MDSPSSEPTLFSAVVTPHRSLGRAGIRLVIIILAAASATIGAAFLAAGAWPVSGFLGLDIGLVYFAFRASARQARAHEHVLVTPSRLELRRVSHTGEVSGFTLNPVWTKLDREVDPDFGLVRIALVSQGRRLPVGQWLSPAEREEFAAALAAALAEARRGPTRSTDAPLGNRVDPPGDAP